MTLERDLAPELNRALADLPSMPATSYLTAARKVRRRRRVVTGAVASAVLVGGLAIAPSLDDPAHRTQVASPGPSLEDGGTVTPVTGPALKGIDAFTTEGIPSWAQEYGNHGPVALAPDGRLWVAPGAVVQRAVVNPLGSTGTEDAPTSYAIEARYEDTTTWILLPGIMDEPGRWTSDFDLWVDDVTSRVQGRPTVAERLVHFVGPNSERLAAGDGVELVRQTSEVELPSYEQHPRSSAAEVRWGGKTWFVLAQGPASGPPFYEAYEQAVSAPDLDGFVAWLGRAA
jgi:hypothetical protein